MDRQQIGLKLTLDALDRPLHLDAFPDRLVLQKAIYLAQAAGVQLGYQFHWYLRGPYSPSLTRDAFAVLAELSQQDDSQGWTLDPTSSKRLEKLRKLFEGISAAQLPSRLELLASVHFLMETRAGQSKDSAHLRDLLERNNKHYSEEQIQQAVEELTQYGFCPGSRST